MLLTSTSDHSTKRSANAGDTQKKQGAYGKIKTHKESMLSQLSHFDEVWSAITLLYLKPLCSNLDTEYIKKTFPPAELRSCHDILGKVSRSFAAVIRQLPSQFLVDILIFYLVLRALHTIEDDTTSFASHAVKVEHLVDFYENALNDPKYRRGYEKEPSRFLRAFYVKHVQPSR